jgi:uncharacterized protein (DUF302 family)
MRYYFSTKLAGTFAEALDRTRNALQSEGFGVISEIDIQKTLKEKIGVEFRPYVILGACNPTLAHEALLLEDKVGTMLPCNVVVQEASDGIEVAAIDPVASMQAIQNERLGDKAAAVGEKLRRAILSLAGPSGMAQADLDEHRAEIERHADESRHELDSVVPPGTDPLHEGP